MAELLLVVYPIPNYHGKHARGFLHLKWKCFDGVNVVVDDDYGYFLIYC